MLLMTSGMAGQPGTLMTGLSCTSLWMGVARVGLGWAACMQPHEAQLPQAITARDAAAP